MKICRYCIKIVGDQASVRQGDADEPFNPRKVSLSLNDRLVIKGQETSLGELLDALIDYNEDWLHTFFDERGQMDTGIYLYQQLFGKYKADAMQNNCDAVDLRIISSDENISRLPWMLLADQGVFLSTAGWSISLASDVFQSSHELPPSPTILAVTPQPSGWGNTEAQEHITEFQEMLATADIAYTDDSRFKNVCTWSAFFTHLETFQPDILYYYGHGTGDRHTTRLVFMDENKRGIKKPLPDILAALQHVQSHIPSLAYINCCQGDAGGLLGVGKQLASLIPAVVTNRTTAFINAARPQAMAFWEAVLLRGEPPHKAVSTMRSRLEDLNLSTADTRWMTPVLHCGYGDWRANPPTPPSRLERDPHWQLKLDRVSQFSKVYYQTSQMFRERKPRALAYLWYGAPEQGMEIFHRRLGEELAESLPDVVRYEVRPAWPDDLYDPERSFSDMFCQAFQVSNLDHLPGRIRTYGRQITGKRILVYIRHQPVQSELRFDPKNIKIYLEWWSRKFVRRMPGSAHALLGLSFEVGKPTKFHKWLTEKQRLHELVLPDSLFELLDQLEKVTKRDLQAFIQTHNIELPPDIQETILGEILKKTEGSYVMLLDELRQLESRAWRKRVETRENGAETYGDEDDATDFF
jgi:hypothetical protein